MSLNSIFYTGCSLNYYTLQLYLNPISYEFKLAHIVTVVLHIVTVLHMLYVLHASPSLPCCSESLISVLFLKVLRSGNKSGDTLEVGVPLFPHLFSSSLSLLYTDIVLLVSYLQSQGCV